MSKVPAVIQTALIDMLQSGCPDGTVETWLLAALDCYSCKEWDLDSQWQSACKTSKHATSLEVCSQSLVIPK